MLISVHHRLTLDLGTGLTRAVQHLLLTPQDCGAQAVREWHIDMPGVDEVPGFFDAFGNLAHLASQTRPEGELTIAVNGVVETEDRAGVIGRLEREPVVALFRRVTPLTRPNPEIAAPFLQAPRSGKDRIAVLHALMDRVPEVLNAPAEAGDAHDASADDYAHAFIGAARELGIPARYVTGYCAADDATPAGFHGWAEAFDDSLGWIGFDVVAGACPVDRHVRVACGLDARSAAPVRAYPSSEAPQHLRMQVEAVAQ